MIIQLISYFGAVFGFLFLVLSIAAGLYYLSEMVEEHSEPTKRFLTRSIYTIMVLFVLLYLFDSFPFMLIAFSIGSCYVYLQNLKRFPYVNFSDPVFISSCVLVALNHYFWFHWFSNPHIPSLEERIKPSYVPPRIPSFIEVASFFGICIWFIPFALFVSLSANENILPSSGEYNASSSTKEKFKKNGLAKVAVARIRDTVYSLSRQLGYELDPNHGVIV